MQFNNLFVDPIKATAPPRTGDIKKKFIQEKLKELGVDISDISLGDFDAIGKYTAEKQRSRDSELYKKAGAWFRPNYERGILIYSLIKKYKVESYLEIGYGRGYSCFCAALAFSELGKGKVTTVDPALDQEQVQNLTGIFPREWFNFIDFWKGTSDDFFNQSNEKYDMIYVDGDHRYSAVLKDWNNCKDRYNKLILFDDYHLPEKVQKDIDVSNVIDAIEDPSKELIIMDRRIFFDDRRIPDEDINYGQVLLTK